MNRTIKEATVKRYHYDSHAQLNTHMHNFIDAYNYGRRLKTLRGLTPYEYVCKCWTSEPQRFIKSAPSNAGSKQLEIGFGLQEIEQDLEDTLERVRSIRQQVG